MLDSPPEDKSFNDPAQRTISRWWLLALGLWALAIFVTSCFVIRPHEFFTMVQDWGLVDTDSMQDFRIFWGIWWFTIVKGWHFTEYALLTLFAAWTLNAWRPRLGQWAIGWAMLGGLAFAVSDEWHQTFVPDRYGTVTDVAIDSMGVLTASVFLLIRFRRQEQAEESSG